MHIKAELELYALSGKYRIEEDPIECGALTFPLEILNICWKIKKHKFLHRKHLILCVSDNENEAMSSIFSFNEIIFLVFMY